MSEEVEINVKLSSEWHNNMPPICKVFLDEIELFDGKLWELKEKGEIKDIAWKGELDEGEHTIRVQLHKKSSRHTKVDENNNIVKDQLIFVEDIAIDQIEIGHVSYTRGSFYPEDTNNPIETENVNCLGFNGEWRLKFEVPTYIWLLEAF
jgi:hypothetical protein